MPGSRTPRTVAIAAALLALAAPAAWAQSGASADPAARGLPVVKCSPETNSCDDAAERKFTMPVLGPGGRNTVLSPSLRSTEVALDSAEYRVLIPGCTPIGDGVFTCESANQYQHCRTLMYSSMVHSCRAPDPFAAGFDAAREAAPGEYRVAIESSARVKVTRSFRGFGETRGEARVELNIDPPQEADSGSCLQRDRLLYSLTGPEGGLAEIDDSGACEEPIEFRFKPHEDDVVRAYDICEAFSAWGSEIDDSIDILAAGLFHVRSADPEFVARNESGVAIIALHVSLTAPLSIDCSE